MKIPVNVTVTSKKHLLITESGENETEQSRSTAPGFLSETKRGIDLVYGNTQKTSVTVIGTTTVAMSTDITGGSYMIFEEGKTNNCIVSSGPIPLELRIKTRKLSTTLSKDGGKIELDYLISIVGNEAENSTLTIDVTPKEQKITS